MYICICVYVYMCICVYAYMCICVYVYMCICVYVYMYTLGDHLLIEIRTEFETPRVSAACYRMPRWWSNGAPWEQGLSANTFVLNSLRGLYEQAIGCVWSGGISRHLAEWLADSSAWLWELVMALIRDGYVLPRSAPRPRGVPGRQLEAWTSGSVTEWQAQMIRAVSAGEVPRNLVNLCYKWMQPAKVSPPERLAADGATLSASQSHDMWCQQVVGQRTWPNDFDLDWHKEVEENVKKAAGRSWSNRGRGVFDWDVDATEVSAIIRSWDRSDATTPDLVPRAVFKLGCAPLDGAVLQLMRLLGPGVLALKPMVWRYRCMVPIYKKGPVSEVGSWRQLEVQTQLGLLQEGIIFCRVKLHVRRYICVGQSGYVRDVGDAHLLVHELAASAEQGGRSLWCFLGDLWKAFARTWRAGLLHCLGSTGLRGGTHAFLTDMLRFDFILVCVNGYRVVRVTEGVSEGGLTGPLGFNLLPDVLVK
jgi:hypothetical protein